jgi:hypothetical protein
MVRKRRKVTLMDRYWITGVQLGLLKTRSVISAIIHDTQNKLIDEVIATQFIGSFPTDADKKRFEKQIRKVK